MKLWYDEWISKLKVFRKYTVYVTVKVKFENKLELQISLSVFLITFVAFCLIICLLWLYCIPVLNKILDLPYAHYIISCYKTKLDNYKSISCCWYALWRRQAMCAVVLKGVAMCEMFEYCVLYDSLFFVHFSKNV